MSIQARPKPVELSPESAAVIVVDMQNDFASTGGMFERAGIDVGCIQAIVPATADSLAEAVAPLAASAATPARAGVEASDG